MSDLVATEQPPRLCLHVNCPAASCLDPRDGARLIQESFYALRKQIYDRLWCGVCENGRYTETCKTCSVE